MSYIKRFAVTGSVCPSTPIFGQRAAAEVARLAPQYDRVVVAGIGITPNVSLAKSAGLSIGNGVIVNEFLQTSAPDIYAAGDIARYPDAQTGEPTRIEHWVVAERQGRVAALNMLGMNVPFTSVPFFWTTQFDTTINYVGHATKWTDIRTDGSP